MNTDTYQVVQEKKITLRLIITTNADNNQALSLQEACVYGET
jgi:hypothetical protein